MKLTLSGSTLYITLAVLALALEGVGIVTHGVSRTRYQANEKPVLQLSPADQVDPSLPDSFQPGATAGYLPADHAL